MGTVFLIPEGTGWRPPDLDEDPPDLDGDSQSWAETPADLDGDPAVNRMIDTQVFFQH